MIEHSAPMKSGFLNRRSQVRFLPGVLVFPVVSSSYPTAPL